MPDIPPPKRQPHPVTAPNGRRRSSGREPRYAELHCKTNCSFLEGASHPDELVARAHELEYAALAITDRNSLAGVVRAHVAAKDTGLKLLIGAEVTPTDALPVILLATNRAAYGRLSQLITHGRRNAPKGECRLTFEDVAHHAEGLLACVVLGGRDQGLGIRDQGSGIRSRGAGGGEQRSGSRDQGSGVGGRGAEIEGQGSGIGDRESGIGDQGAGSRDREPEVRGRKSERLLSGTQCLAVLSTQYSVLNTQYSERPQNVRNSNSVLSTLDSGLQTLTPRPSTLNFHPAPLNPQPSQLSASGSQVLAFDSQLSTLNSYRDVFGDRCYALAELHCGTSDQWLLEQMVQIAARARVPLVAANDVHYHVPARRVLQDVLTAVREQCTVAELGRRLFANGERYLKSYAEMLRLFADAPEALRRTREVADRCQFSLDELRYNYPEELCPRGMTPIDHLTRLTWDGGRHRYPHGIPEKVRRLVEHELQLIEELHYEAYFLTVWDLVCFARRRGILCQGRGSAANSAVCYCLGITSVDPDRIEVLFERFVSKERNEAPDIDVDFEHERREEVIQYIYDKYGRDRAGMTAEVITYRPRSAVRDVGKALGLSLDCVDVLAKSLEHFNEPEKLKERFRETGFDSDSPVGRQLVTLVRELVGFPRHLSQHVGGLVITQDRLSELVPLENAAMRDRTVIQWDKDDLDALGILKVDCLSLGMLTAIRKCFDLVERHQLRGRGSRSVAGSGDPATTDSLTLANIPAEDPQVYDMISRADTMGVFQIESRAQMSMLPRLKPRCFYDLVIEVAIVRPGPIQGDMVHPYLRRRNGEEPVAYPDERIRAVLEKTLGVPLFQEQAMRLAVVAAGFTPGEADQLRRAMGAWRRPGVIDQFHQKLIDGMTANGYGAGFAEQVFRQIRGFGEYGFPESHAASFALLVYVSAWLKRYYPAAFTAALLNSQPMGFYAPAQLVSDARKHGVEVRPVDVNFSDWDCTLEPTHADVVKMGQAPNVLFGASPIFITGTERPVRSQSHFPAALRLGFRMVRGLAWKHVQHIVRQRGQEPFESFEAFVKRTGLSSAVLQQLSQADAFRSLRLNRRQAVWRSLPPQTPVPLFASEAEPVVSLPSMAPQDEVAADYHSTGLSLRSHPVTFIRKELDRLRVVCASQLAVLPAGRPVRVAGLVLLRQRPSTAGGITFVSLEDETGIANLIIRPQVWERYRRVAHTSNAVIASGELQRESNVIHVVVSRLQDLGHLLGELRTSSRDFQ